MLRDYDDIGGDHPFPRTGGAPTSASDQASTRAGIAEARGPLCEMVLSSAWRSYRRASARHVAWRSSHVDAARTVASSSPGFDGAMSSSGASVSVYERPSRSLG